MALVKDPVPPIERAAVYERDEGCIASLLDPGAGPCRDKWRVIRPRWFGGSRFRTLDHVPKGPGATRVSTRRWMVCLCWEHGVYSNWATSHRPEERIYLERLYGQED